VSRQTETPALLRKGLSKAATHGLNRLTICED
jgi:hypothetical protein